MIFGILKSSLYIDLGVLPKRGSIVGGAIQTLNSHTEDSNSITMLRTFLRGRMFSTSTIQADIAALKMTNEKSCIASRVQALFSHVGDEQKVPESIHMNDERYTWSVSPAKGMAIDSIFKQKSTAGSEEEREQVSKETSSSLDSLVFGSVPPRSLSALFDRLRSLGLLNQVKEEQIMYDLGSGDGLVCVTCAMLHPFTKVTGYEIIPSLVTASQQRAEDFKLLSSGLEDTVETIDFRLGDCRQSNWSDGHVILANAPCFDGELMNILGDRTKDLAPGSLFISIGRSMQSEYLELVDQVCLPANGLGVYGEPLNDEEEVGSIGAMMNNGNEDNEDEEMNVSNGLFTFNIYQRILDNHDELSSCCDVLVPSITDSPTQSIMRSEGIFSNIMNIISDSENDDKARASSTLLLKACMTSHPSARQMLQNGVLDTIFRIMDKENSMMLQVCGVLLLSELSVTRFGQVSMIKDDRMLRALIGMLDEKNSSPPVVAAAVEIAYNISSFKLGCDFLNGSPLVNASLSVINDDGRAKSVCQRICAAQ
jgi:methylase of polypeptide subunit release factors